MACYNLKVQLAELIESMFEEGLLNEQYHEIKTLKSADYPGFIAEVLTLFCENTETTLTELDKLINEDIVDYEETKQNAFWLKRSGLNWRTKLRCMKRTRRNEKLEFLRV